MTQEGAGRVCPASYSYSPSVFARAPEVVAEVLYVIGGLYGNRFALAEVERMAQCEESRAHLVFNGDFHWFDAAPDVFSLIENTVARHSALRGNVETEIASDDDRNGCGCAYPESVPDDDVERSNAILHVLRTVARETEAGGTPVRACLGALPMHLAAQVGDTRIGIVHGDARALAGWRFSHDSLHDARRSEPMGALFDAAEVDGFASTHTCLPALKVFDTDLGERFVINNGAAGMPNFRNTSYGVITRLATVPVPRSLTAARLYGADIAGVYVDAMAVRFDARAWNDEFAQLWPIGSAAHASYHRRIVEGPDFSIDDALGRAVPRGCESVLA